MEGVPCVALHPLCRHGNLRTWTEVTHPQSTGGRTPPKTQSDLAKTQGLLMNRASVGDRAEPTTTHPQEGLKGSVSGRQQPGEEDGDVIFGANNGTVKGVSLREGK